jgi:hypothetical protein
MTNARSLAISRLRPIAPLALICAAACWLSISTYSVFSHTWDEPEHLAAGIALLDTGEYPYDQQHPPLARLAMAIGPYLAGAHSHGNAGPSGEEEGRDILYDEGRYDRYLALARIGMLPFLVAALMATWLWTRRLFGDTEAIVATALVAGTPVIIGHAAVAALDVPMMGTSLVALYVLHIWITRRTLASAVALGVATGIAAGTKLSSIPFIACVALVWFAIAWFAETANRSESAPRAADAPPLFSLKVFLQIAASLAVAALSLLACYGFALDHAVTSFEKLLEHNQSGHLSYFMGELKRTGWWNFYLVGVAVKTPIPLLVGGLCGSVWLLFRAFRNGAWLRATPALAWIAVLLFASAYSHINIGIRHVLLILPLLAMNAAALGVAIWRNSSIAVRGLVLLLVTWQATSMAFAHPDYLPYFNELAGSRPEKLLIDSDLDWGQDLRRLKQTLRERKIERFSFVFRGTADLEREGFPSYQFLWPHKHATGWIAVSLLAKATGTEDGGYDWLDAYQPVLRVGKSIDLYYIEE